MLPTPTPQIVIVNESTHLSETEAWNIAWALGYQVRWQFAPHWKLTATVSLLPKGAPVPTLGWILHLLDTSDQESALGYHDEAGDQVPYARVFIETAKEAGLTPSEVASHECLEMLVDPHVNGTAWDGKSRLYAMEVGDAVQGTAYDLGAPYDRTTGLIVSDFALAEWFDPNTPPEQITNYRGTFDQAAEMLGGFQLGGGGYVSYTEKLPPAWAQERGAHARQSVIDADDRVTRRQRAIPTG